MGMAFLFDFLKTHASYTCLETQFLFRSDAIREKMKKNYMSNPSYNYEIVNRASLACGPMVKWAIAQVSGVAGSSRVRGPLPSSHS